MRSVSPELAAAIESPERVLRHRLTVDWDADGYNGNGTIDDLTDKIGQLKATQQLQTQVPEGVRVVAGNAAAQLDVDLARGNVINAAVPAAYRSINTGQTTSGTSASISVAKPAGVQAGDVVLLFIVFVNEIVGITDMPTGGSPNVTWSLISARGDSLIDTTSGRLVGYALTRRATASEPANYTYTADAACSWVAAAVAVGGPGIAGIHAIATDGQGDGITATRDLQVGQLDVTLPGSTLVSFLAAALEAGKTATVTPGAGMTEVAELQTSLAAGRNVIAEVAYRDGTPAGDYTVTATVNPPAQLHPNPDVETNLTGWTTGAPSSGTVTRSNDTAHHGDWSVKVVPTGSDQYAAALSDMFAVTAGTTYTGSVWCYGSIYREELGPVILFYNASNTLIGTAQTLLPTFPGQWTLRRLVSAVAPVGATQARFGARAGGPGNPPSTAVFYFDQAMVRAGTVDADIDSAVGLGFAVALAPALAGDDGQAAAWTFSELNPLSPYAGKPRADRRTTWALEVLTSTGFQSVPIFTGLSVDASGSARSRSAKLIAIDNRQEWIEPQQQLPPILADYPGYELQPLKPGLEATWFVSWLMWTGRTASSTGGIYVPEIAGPERGYGNFASPNIRPDSTMLWAPMHGSMVPFWPSQDALEEAWTRQNDGTVRRVRFLSGPYVAAPEDPAPLGRVFARYHISGSAVRSFESFPDGQLLGRIEFAARQWTTGAGSQVLVQYDLLNNAKWVEARLLSSGTMRLRIQPPTGAAVVSVAGPAYPSDGEWHWYGFRFDSYSHNVVFSIDGVDTTVSFTAWSSAADLEADTWEVLYDCAQGWQFAELHVNGSLGTRGLPSGSPWVWTGFTPTAFIDKSENELDVTPPIDAGDDAWAVLQDIAGAELAAVYRDADGYPHFRTALSDMSAAGQTIARTVSALSALKDVDYVSGITQLRNSVTVPYTGVELHLDEPLQISGTYRVPAGGDLVLSVTLGGPALGSFIGPGAPSASISAANTAADGTGSSVPLFHLGVGIATTPGSSTATLSVSSDAPYDVWLVDGSGQNSLSAVASWFQFGTAVDVVVEHAESIRRNRRRRYAFDASPWRQREEAAYAIAARICDDLAFARATLRTVKIVGDPRLEIGDLVRLVDRDGLGIDGLFRISGMSPAGAPSGGFTQDITARAAQTAATWDVNSWDDGTIWSE